MQVNNDVARLRVTAYAVIPDDTFVDHRQVVAVSTFGGDIEQRAPLLARSEKGDYLGKDDIFFATISVRAVQRRFERESDVPPCGLAIVPDDEIQDVLTYGTLFQKGDDVWLRFLPLQLLRLFTGIGGFL